MNASIQGIFLSDPTWTAEVQAIDLEGKILKKTENQDQRGPVNRCPSRWEDAPGTGCYDRFVSTFQNRTPSKRNSPETPKEAKRTGAPIHGRDSGTVLDLIVSGLPAWKRKVLDRTRDGRAKEQRRTTLLGYAKRRRAVFETPNEPRRTDAHLEVGEHFRRENCEHPRKR